MTHALYTPYDKGSQGDLFMGVIATTAVFPVNGAGVVTGTVGSSLFAPTIDPDNVAWDATRKVMTSSAFGRISRTGMELIRVTNAGASSLGSTGYFEIQDRFGGAQGLNEDEIYVPDWDASVDVSIGGGDIEVQVYGDEQFVWLKGFCCDSHNVNGNITSVTVVDDAGAVYSLGAIGGAFNATGVGASTGGAGMPYFPKGILLRRGLGAKLALIGGRMGVLFRPFSSAHSV